MTTRFRLPSLLSALALLSMSCDDGSVAGGTSGAEAENAIALVVRAPGGRPAPGVAVVARPADAMSDSVWSRSVSDASGTVIFRLPPARTWLLEAESGPLAALLRIDPATPPPNGILELDSTASIVGRLVPGAAGTRIAVSGLGRIATLDTSGRFRFDRLPAGTVELRLEGSLVPWRVLLQPGGTTRVSLDSLAPGSFAGDPARALLYVDSLPREGVANALLPLELALPPGVTLPWNRLRFLDDSGRILPAMLAVSDSASRRLRLWVRARSVPPTGRLRAILDSAPSSPIPNPFHGAAGLGDLLSAFLFSHVPSGEHHDIVYDLARDTLANPRDSSIAVQIPTANTYASDPAGMLGAGLSNTIGNIVHGTSNQLSFGTADNSTAPRFGGVFVRARALETEPNALFHMTDTTGSTMAEVARVGDSLRITSRLESSDGGSPTTHTTWIAFPMDARWHSYAIDFPQTGIFVLHVDGSLVASIPFSAKRNRVMVMIASGSETRVAEVFQWEASRLDPAQRLLLVRPSRTRVYSAVP